MSKSVRTVIGVVAAIAIPFAAPIIATSIGMSAAIGSAIGSATAGSVLGGAITGAALGAAKGAILGEDVGRSTLMGGLGGGIGGYANAPAAPAGGALGGTGLSPTSVGANTTAGSQYAMTGSGGYGLSAGGASTPGLSLGGTSYGMSPTTAGLSGVMSASPSGVDYSLTATPTASPSGVDYSLTAQPTAGASSADYGLAAPSVSAAQGTASSGVPGAPKTFSDVLSQAGEAIKAKFTDPKNLADLTLRAAGQLAGSALAGNGLSNEEQQLLAAQTEELRQLQQTNQALFNQRLEQAQNLMGESQYFDPEYFGLQRARRAQLTGAKAKQAGLRGLTGERRASESRRFDLATGRDTGTAYDQGYMSAIAPRLQTMQAGLSSMPSGYPSSMGDYRNLQATYDTASRRARQTQGDIGELFGSLTGSQKAQSLG